MSRPPSLLKPQTSTLFSLLPTSPFSLLTSRYLSPSQTRLKLKFSHKASVLSSSSLSPPFQLSPQSQQQQDFTDHGDEEDEEHVVGDCLVFEEGIFEDPYLRESSDSGPNLVKPKYRTPVEVKPEDLIPEKWKEAQAEINITKKERRKMAQEMEFGRSVEKRKKSLLPIREVSVEDYKAYRETKLSQLKPIVLKSPRFLGAAEKINEKDGGESEEDDVSVPTRVSPRNPRLAVYGVSMDDISEFFNSDNYDPKAAKSPEGRRKLFTTEEKLLLNMRKPDLSFAASGRWLPLHTLVASGEFYLVNTLLKHNVDINIENKDGLTALHKSVLSKKQAIFNYLLRESANPFVRDKEGATLMHYAVRAASTPMIKILLLYNVDINLQDNAGWTPLHLAVQTRRTDIVRLLLIKGADKTLKTQNGLTPLDLCLRCGRDTRTCEVVKQLKQEPKARKIP